MTGQNMKAKPVRTRILDSETSSKNIVTQGICGTISLTIYIQMNFQQTLVRILTKFN